MALALELNLVAEDITEEKLTKATFHWGLIKYCKFLLIF